jgi:hypothetical protein
MRRPPHPLELAVVVMMVSGCNGIQPNPSSPTVADVVVTATRLAIVLMPAELPAGGGTARVMIETTGGGVVAPNVAVQLQASSGELSATSITTDRTGHAQLDWTGTSPGTLTATAGELTTTFAIRFIGSAPAPPPPGPGPSPPRPRPPPPPPPPPGPPPGPPAPPPGPAGDLVLTITPSPANPDASQSVTWTATLSSSTGAAVPFMDRFGWDVDGDSLPEHTEPSPVVTYAAGTYTAFLQVLTSDQRAVQATRSITVAPAPVVSVTLAASPSTTDLATAVTFTATASTVGPTGAVTSYAWDFDNNGTTDQTTAGNTTSFTYPSIGSKTARVRATSANGQTGTATTPVTVSAPPLVVGLSVAGAQTAGSTNTFTAMVTSSGTGANGVPPSMTFAWDYDNNDTVEEVTTGGSPRSVNRVFNVPGTYTVRVTVTAPDGRTATNTITVTIT